MTTIAIITRLSLVYKRHSQNVPSGGGYDWTITLVERMKHYLNLFSQLLMFFFTIPCSLFAMFTVASTHVQVFPLPQFTRYDKKHVEYLYISYAMVSVENREENISDCNTFMSVT